jgi:AcrR family transcriptional regulator
VAPALSHNLNGQRLGRKGRDTRDRILSATRDLLEAPLETQITLSAVAREAGLGMTSLYKYFGDLTELLVSVLAPVSAEADAGYLAQLREPWPDEALFDHALTFMKSYHGFWVQHSRLLHLRDTLAGQGDKRMMDQRVLLSMKTIELLINQMGGKVDELYSPAMGMATVLYAGFERVVVISTDTSMPSQIERPFEPRIEHLLTAEAQLIEFGIRQFRKGG